MSSLSRAILKTVLYFDVFKFPLTKEEIQNYVAYRQDVTHDLEELVNDGLLARQGPYFGCPDLKSKIEGRKKGACEAEKMMRPAVRISNLLSWVPFIRCVCLSGSLSKGYMDKQSDIDYFIIVKENRLWIVRALFSLVIFCLAALRIKKYFCPNYIMVDSNLYVKDQNTFTATEITSLIPLYNQAVYDDFMQQNIWVSEHLPNARKGRSRVVEERKQWLAFLWNSVVFDWIDDACFSMYKWHYGRKFRNLDRWKLTQTDVNFRKNIYKMHNTGHRSRILDQFNQNVHQFEQRFNIALSI